MSRKFIPFFKQKFKMSNETEIQEKKIKIDFNEIKEIVPILTIGIVLLGFFNVYHYYSLFGIVITPYLETTEIIFSFSSLFISLIFIFSLLLVVLLFIIIGLEVRWIKPEGNTSIRMLVTLAIILLPIYAFIYFFGSLMVVENPLDAVVIHLILLIAVLTIGKVARYKIVIIFFVYSICFLAYRNIVDFKKITNELQHSYHVNLKLEDVNLSTSKDFFYIGSTRRYVFFWDSFSKKAMVYPLSDIKWLSVQKNDAHKK